MTVNEKTGFFLSERTAYRTSLATSRFVDDQSARQFADRLLATRIITGFGMLAFVVAAAGIYGMMAFLVANRAREIGIRMALGADSRRIRRPVLESSMRLVPLGAAIGIGGAFAASRWAQSQLFGVSATDPVTIVLVTVAVIVTALVATWHPARMATRVDPMTLLRTARRYCPARIKSSRRLRSSNGMSPLLSMVIQPL
jgi:ABC-type antimicrobial peptide transport system permease subunit